LIELIVWDTPPSGNSLRRKYRNPHVYARLRDSWGWSLAAAASPNERSFLKGIPATGKRVRVIISVQHRQLLDPDNLYAAVKPILDSLVGLGWLRDDSEEHIELQAVQIKGEVAKTVIRMELI